MPESARTCDGCILNNSVLSVPSGYSATHFPFLPALSLYSVALGFETVDG